MLKIFSPLIIFAVVSKNSCLYVHGLFLDSLYYLLMCVYFCQSHEVFVPCSTIVGLKNQVLLAFQLCSSFSKMFQLLYTLLFCLHFRTNLTISTKKIQKNPGGLILVIYIYIYIYIYTHTHTHTYTHTHIHIHIPSNSEHKSGIVMLISDEVDFKTCLT